MEKIILMCPVIEYIKDIIVINKLNFNLNKINWNDSNYTNMAQFIKKFNKEFNEYIKNIINDKDYREVLKVLSFALDLRKIEEGQEFEELAKKIYKKADKFLTI